MMGLHTVRLKLACTGGDRVFLCAGFEIQKKRLGIGPDTAVSVRKLSVLIKHQHLANQHVGVWESLSWREDER